MVAGLQDLMERAAQRAPDSEAARCEGQSLSYGELARRSNQLARTLVDSGVQSGDRVALYLDKSLEGLVAVYAVLKAGAAYVPIDPSSPISRAAFVLRDCGVRHVISRPESASRLATITRSHSEIECLVGVEECQGVTPRCVSWAEVWEGNDASLKEPGGGAKDLSYVLYTSGSTGLPKGVVHTHESALAFVEWAAKTFHIEASDRLSNHAAWNFDLSVFDLFAGASAGARVVIVPELVTKFPASLGDLVEEERLTVWYSVPFALVQLLERGALGGRDLTALRTVLFAGEAFPPKYLARLMDRLAGTEFYNLYGPTETNVCTYHAVPRSFVAAPESVPIGVACGDAELRVMSGNGREVGLGESGELWVRSPTNMTGYWRRPDLTQSAFGTVNGEPFYRTGDVVRIDNDGSYRFLGRADRQVKVRGYRVELDEIELALLSHDEVTEAAAYLVESDSGAATIEAAVAVVTGSTASAGEVTRHAAKHLPLYAVPGRILMSGGFPRTANGKIDRQALERQASLEVAHG